MTPRHHKSPIVCACLQVTEDEIVKAIEAKKIQAVKDIIQYTKAGEGCTACHPMLRELLERSRQRR